jgi:hypothetical protein
MDGFTSSECFATLLYTLEVQDANIGLVTDSPSGVYSFSSQSFQENARIVSQLRPVLHSSLLLLLLCHYSLTNHIKFEDKKVELPITLFYKT